MSRFTAAAVAAVATSLFLAPLAAADPDTAPADPAVTQDETPEVPPLVPLAAPEGSIVDVSVLPLFKEAQWRPVPNWDFASPYLTGVEICSPFGQPDPNADPKPPTSDVQHVVLAPGDNGNPQGWTATLSFAPYASLNDSIGALHSYKVYVEKCPLMMDGATVQNNGGIARNDPTNAHGVMVTNDHYQELFLTALPTGVVELALTRPNDAEQVSLEYSPRDIIASLRGAVVRPPAPAGPFGWGR